MPVRLQKGLGLAAVPPSRDRGGADAGALVHHVLEGVGQVELAPGSRLALQGVVDPLEEELVVPDVVEPDVGQLRDRLVRLLDDPGHGPVLVGDDDAEPLVVLHLLRPDHAGPLLAQGAGEAQVGSEEGVHEHDEDLAVHVLPGEPHGPGRSVLDLLDHEVGGERRILLRHVLPDHVAKIADDEDDLLDPQLDEIVQDVAHDGAACHADQGLGGAVRVGPETGTFAGQGDDRFHRTLERLRCACSLLGVTQEYPGSGALGKPEGAAPAPPPRPAIRGSEGEGGIPDPSTRTAPTRASDRGGKSP